MYLWLHYPEAVERWQERPEVNSGPRPEKVWEPPALLTNLCGMGNKPSLMNFTGGCDTWPLLLQSTQQWKTSWTPNKRSLHLTCLLVLDKPQLQKTNPFLKITQWELLKGQCKNHVNNQCTLFSCVILYKNVDTHIKGNYIFFELGQGPHWTQAPSL